MASCFYATVCSDDYANLSSVVCATKQNKAHLQPRRGQCCKGPKHKDCYAVVSGYILATQRLQIWRIYVKAEEPLLVNVCVL